LKVAATTSKKDQSLSWMRSSGDNHRVGEPVRRWSEHYRPLANGGESSTAVGDGSVGVTAPGVAALSCFELEMTPDNSRASL
jgi:hypothetical protein